jgi:hypothetical protein
MAEDRAPSCKRRDVLELKPEVVTERWNTAVDALIEVLEILRSEWGILSKDLLPYETMLYPLAAAWALGRGAKGAQHGANRQKLIRWFWCSVFGQSYENSPNSQAAKDVVELRRWFGGGDPPDSVQSFEFDPAQLRETTTRQRALFRGVLAAVVRHRAKDFHRVEDLTPKLLSEEKIDVHHLFPRRFLGDRYPASLVNSVLNQTFINARTNRSIGARPPSQYLTIIQNDLEPKDVRAGKLPEVLRSHLITAEAEAAMRRDNFDGFLEAREAAIGAEIGILTGV